ncbi:MAG: hypothetical protein RLZZ618_634 [Pseudomonadota bacterium]|jgi:hypothetical protein
MIDELIPLVEEVRAQGALVILKWDGERTHSVCTVVITRQDTDFVWRKDCNDVGATLAEALADYKAAHSH